MSGGPSHVELVHAYRHLYRGLLHAVCFSAPARFTARDRLRDAFRRGAVAQYDARKIENTLEFLRGAARETGMEHRILKNLLMVRFWERDKLSRYLQTSKAQRDLVSHKEVYHHFNRTVDMLNRSLGLCLA
ncbi:MAG: hypothetical protein M1838_000724 [Thelocarpon superellum]|nr:MAG: hypothetical protein M1838_000724 [Thelocarpon superellum]